MAQITENMVLDMLTACERNEHPPLTVWEAKQLLHAWREREALRKDADLLAWVLAHPETAAEELEDAAGGDGDARQNLEWRRAGIEAARKAEADGGRLLGDA